MTRNQRLSRALMWAFVSALCGISALLHFGFGRYGVAGLLSAICGLSGALTVFNHEEAKHL